MNGILEDVAFSDWLLPLSTQLSRSIHVLSRVSTSILVLAE